MASTDTHQCSTVVGVTKADGAVGRLVPEQVVFQTGEDLVAVASSHLVHPQSPLADWTPSSPWPGMVYSPGRLSSLTTHIAGQPCRHSTPDSGRTAIPTARPYWCSAVVPGRPGDLPGGGLRPGSAHQRTSLITPAQASCGRPRHRTDLRDCRNGDVSRRCRLRGHCTTSHDLIKIVLGQHPLPANFAARKPASTKLVRKPARLAAEKGSRLIEGEKKWCRGGHGGSTPAERNRPLALMAGACCRCRAAVALLERPSDAPLPIQRPKHAFHITRRYGPLLSKRF
jgi:hypothetical protein